MAVYFTSDTHFGHHNIIRYCSRPFDNVYHMNEFMIAAWNDVVQPDDTVYHLGDFVMGNSRAHRPIFERLNGRKIIVRGNHDPSEAKLRAIGWDEVSVTRFEVIEGRQVYMAHIPPVVFDGRVGRVYKPEFTPAPPDEYDIWLCGHVHEKWTRRGNIVNVGVDRWDYRPQTFASLIAATVSNGTAHAP